MVAPDEELGGYRSLDMPSRGWLARPRAAAPFPLFQSSSARGRPSGRQAARDSMPTVRRIIVVKASCGRRPFQVRDADGWKQTRARLLPAGSMLLARGLGRRRARGPAHTFRRREPPTTSRTRRTRVRGLSLEMTYTVCAPRPPGSTDEDSFHRQHRGHHSRSS